MKRTSASKLAKALKISKARSIEAVLKAELIHAVNEVINNEKMTHEKLAEKAGLSRSSVSGILSGSLQKVTIDRILRLIQAVGLELEIRLKKAA